MTRHDHYHHVRIPAVRWLFEALVHGFVFWTALIAVLGLIALCIAVPWVTFILVGLLVVVGFGYGAWLRRDVDL